MAKLTIRNEGPLARVDTADGTHRYTLRSNGTIVAQFRLDGRLDPAHQIAKFKDEVIADRARLLAAFDRWAEKRGLPSPERLA